MKKSLNKSVKNITPMKKTNTYFDIDAVSSRYSTPNKKTPLTIKSAEKKLNPID